MTPALQPSGGGVAIAHIELAGLAPATRALVLRKIAENEQLAADLAEMRARVAELERLVDSDTLTPLPNRRHFIRALNRAIESRRIFGTPAVLMFVDVDNLKAINDLHGHLAGDAALVHVAAILAASLETGDFVARLGGDEFALLLEHVDLNRAEAKAALLVELAATAPLDLGRRQISLGLSIGVAEISANDSVDTVIARADAAMYTAKAQARSER